MDAALSFRAMHPQAPAQPRAEVAPVREAVPTVLPQPDQSVAATAESAAGRPRSKGELPKLSDDVMRELERELEFNEETRDLVSRTLDGETGRVLNQFPAETLLKLRAYVQSQDSQTADPFVTREA